MSNPLVRPGQTIAGGIGERVLWDCDTVVFSSGQGFFMRTQQTCRLLLLLIATLALGCNQEGDSTSGVMPDVQGIDPVTDGGAPPSMDIGGAVDAGQTADAAPSASDSSAIDADSTDAAREADVADLPDYDGPRKKGIAMHQGFNLDWSEKVAAVKPFWSYSWGLTLSQFQPDGVEFVPMKWSGRLSDEQAESLRQQYAAGDIKYLLGYNEPDGERQANMSVDRAIELWPQLEATGIPLVSPSPVHYDNDWMVEFMRRADENNLRIDYLAFHWYGGTDAQYFLDLLDQVYARYQLPIWITEFAPADWQTNTREGNRMRPEAVLEFMRVVLPELDRRDYIVRYAWFTDCSGNPLWTSALFCDGALTPLGEFYAQHSANPAAGPGKPYPAPINQEGNLLSNGGFDLGDNGDWGGYEKRFISIDDTETHEGAFCVSLRGGFSSAIDQQVTLEAGVTYRISVHTRWSEATDANVNANIGVEGSGNPTSARLHGGTDWQETSFTVTPDATQTYVFWIWTGPGIPAHLYVDTVSIRPEGPNP